MCGIVAIYGSSLSIEEKRTQMGAMLGELEHRGPDAWGTFCSPHIGLGHVRLSIVDLKAGHQPLIIGDDIITYNGEVFNYVELREELDARGERFITRSDTEVLLRALRCWGVDALARLNGQFSFAWWNNVSKRLVVVRDRYGVRPVFYTQHRGMTYFASEMKAFDAVPGLARTLDPANVLELGLFWNNLGDRTPFREIRAIEAGTYLVLEHGAGPTVHRWHQLGDTLPAELPGSFDEAKAMLRERLSRAVSLRLRSDVPVGNYLSGGIDSSVTTLLTDRLRTDRFRTFSIAFRDAAFDESDFQAMMAQRLHADSSTLTVDDRDIETHFERAVFHAERPLFRTAPVPLLMLAREVRASGIRVVLTGEAADEILWGYDSFKELKLLQFWAKHPKSELRPLLIRKLYPHLQRYRDTRNFGLMRMFYESFLSSYDNALLGLNMRIYNNRVLTGYLLAEHRPAAVDTWLLERVEAQLPRDWSRWGMLQRNQFLEMRTLLDGYLLSSQADRMCMAHGIEGRYPFLDADVVEWVFHLPDSWKLPLLSQKHLLREAFREDLPGEIVDRPKQPYQAPDLRAFIRDGKPTELAQAHLSPDAVRDVGLFDPRMVQRFLDKWTRGVPEQVGYRDNMLMCFMLSSQIVAHHAKTLRSAREPRSPKTVDVRAMPESEHQ